MGAERATYALKLLQSEGELKIASTGRDPQTGRLETKDYEVKGPVAIFLSTTATELDEELQNRCIVLTVDEEREQTRAIHRLQRERRTLQGLLARRARERVLRAHRNAQRLLEPLPVVNPYAPALTFLDSRTRTRRDHEKYLTLIEAIALLHQHQRELRRVSHDGAPVRYVEVTLGDIALANRLAHEVLGRSLDELAPQTRRLLGLVDAMVREVAEREAMAREEIRFTQREVREHTGWTDFQVRSHLQKLVALEYVLVHRGGRGQRFLYELLYDGEGRGGEPFLVGLADVEALRGRGYDAKCEGSPAPTEHRNGPTEHAPSPHRAPIEPRPSGVRDRLEPTSGAASGRSAAKTAENAFKGSRKNGAGASYGKGRTPIPLGGAD